MPQLTNKCPICSKTYNTRSILGQHVRKMHHKSLLDLPPYTGGPVTQMEAEPGRPSVAPPQDKEEWPEDKVVLTIQNGTTTLAGSSLQRIEEALQQLKGK